MTFTRWVSPVLVAAFALLGCAEQGADESAMDADTTAMEADTTAMQPDMEPPIGDTSSADIAVWNTDADARLAPDEFSGWLEDQDFYAEWNTDGSAGLTPQEFGAGLAGVLDANDDGAVSAMEWSDVGASWTGPDASLADWDANGDSSLQESEIVSGIEGGALWSDWDQDGNGRLARAEFDAAVFAAWDTNDDNFVDETEWGANFDYWS